MKTQKTIYDLHINAYVENEEYDEAITYSYEVSKEELLFYINNFRADNQGWGDEIELEHTDATISVLEALGIPVPTNTDTWMVVGGPQ